jgi:hypothetical protein
MKLSNVHINKPEVFRSTYLAPMKRLLYFVFALLLLSSCTERKQRDVRKLNWYEVVTEARGKEVRILLPAEEKQVWESRFKAATDKLAQNAALKIRFIACDPASLDDSLSANTTASLLLLRGRALEQALLLEQLMGPFDRLLPIAKKIDTDADVFRRSKGISSQGFAVPVQGILGDTASIAFFGIPKQAAAQAAALLLLETLLEQESLSDSTQAAR